MKSEAASDGSVVILGRINRVRRKAVEFVEGQPPKTRRSRPLRVARTLALAHVFRELIDAGVVRDQAELAAVTGFTRARITQMMDLTLLAPSIQEEILFADEPAGGRGIAERRLREVVARAAWNDQWQAWQGLRASLSCDVGRGSGSC